uniref:Uncharacterized protein n=1 Tax=Arundo donax TaxID=35708 RepID=A0A0A9AQB9_ARUDO
MTRLPAAGGAPRRASAAAAALLRAELVAEQVEEWSGGLVVQATGDRRGEDEDRTWGLGERRRRAAQSVTVGVAFSLLRWLTYPRAP